MTRQGHGCKQGVFGEKGGRVGEDKWTGGSEGEREREREKEGRKKGWKGWVDEVNVAALILAPCGGVVCAL